MGDTDDIDESWLQAPNHYIITAESEDFPELLRQIPGPPTRLYVVGNMDALHLPSLAIVGSRNPTRGGTQNAYNFSNHLARSGFSIVSGLAQGIDTAAHEGALDAGAMTIAFLGHGIDKIYPAENRDLAQRIARSGALCSEYPLGSPPRREHFPQRNRLISGLSLGTLVVEAARRSGSLITARLASEQGREVFAVPGSIHNPLSRGCHQLIKQGGVANDGSGNPVALCEQGQHPFQGRRVLDQKSEISAAAANGEDQVQHIANHIRGRVTGIDLFK